MSEFRKRRSPEGVSQSNECNLDSSERLKRRKESIRDFRIVSEGITFSDLERSVSSTTNNLPQTVPESRPPTPVETSISTSTPVTHDSGFCWGIEPQISGTINPVKAYERDRYQFKDQKDSNDYGYFWDAMD